MTNSTKDTQALLDNPDAVVEPAIKAADNPNQKIIELDEPLQRGSGQIASVMLRKPVSGELRGVSLMDLAQMDVLALRKVLPRITMPALTDHEIGNLTPADLMQFGVAVSGFLLTKQQKAESGFLEA